MTRFDQRFNNKYIISLCNIFICQMSSSKQTIFYYSNFCPHSQRVLQFLVRANLTTEVAFICIDKRGRDPNTNQMYIIMENGDRVLMPPNIHSVPALLMLNSNYKVIYGDEIIRHYEPNIVNDRMLATNFNGEPSGFSLNGSGSSLVDSGSFGVSLSSTYNGRQTIRTPPLEEGSNKIKDGDNTMTNKMEEMRKSQDAQLGFGQPQNPFLQPATY
jgi:hypothetical protein